MRLDQRDEKPCIGEIVELDNLRGIEPLDALMGEPDDEYLDIMLKYNPFGLWGRIIKIGNGELTVRVRWQNGVRNSYYPHNLKEIV